MEISLRWLRSFGTRCGGGSWATGETRNWAAVRWLFGLPLDGRRVRKGTRHSGCRKT